MKRNLSFLVFILTLGFIVASPSNINASSNIKVLLDGQELEFDVPPQIIEGRTLLPLRVIFENLGLTVGWNNETRVITGTNENTEIILTLDRADAKVNGISKTLDVPAKAINGRTLVPVRFIAESLNMVVDWVQDTKTVIINKDDEIITFKDPELDEIIRKMINKPKGNLFKSDVKSITEILYKDTGWSNYKKIKSIEGLENLENLKTIQIENGLINDIKPFANLNKLEEISLPRNKIKNIESIKDLKNLKEIVLSSNNIDDISVLRGLSKLESVAIASNNISDISVLTELPLLKAAYIGRNPIMDDSFYNTMKVLLEKNVDGFHDFYGESIEFSKTELIENEKTNNSSSSSLKTINNDSNEKEIHEYLIANYGILNTIIGNEELIFKVNKNDSMYTRWDYDIETIFPIWRYQEIFNSNKYSSNEKEILKKEIKDHQKDIAEALMDSLPNKRLSGGYYETTYTYPNLKIDSHTKSINVWKNYAWSVNQGASKDYFDKEDAIVTGNTHYLSELVGFRWDTWAGLKHEFEY